MTIVTTLQHHIQKVQKLVIVTHLQHHQNDPNVSDIDSFTTPQERSCTGRNGLARRSIRTPKHADLFEHDSPTANICTCIYTWTRQYVPSRGYIYSESGNWHADLFGHAKMRHKLHGPNFPSPKSLPWQDDSCSLTTTVPYRMLWLRRR